MTTENITFFHANGSDSKSVKLADFVDALQSYINVQTHGFSTVKVSAEPGRKYIRIVVDRSVHCFIDYSGNIYKSASWRAPAKHIRGSIFDDNYSLGKSLGAYGAAYLR